jgi:hypothetical protein
MRMAEWMTSGLVGGLLDAPVALSPGIWTSFTHWLCWIVTRAGLDNMYNCGRIYCDRISDVRFEVFTAVTMKNGVFWDVTSCGSCKTRRFGGT